MKKFVLILYVCVFGLSACKKHKLDNLTGQVQKGPFINGTSISLAELDDLLVPTGKVFGTSISDNKGTFAIPDIKLKSPFVELSADGFYFDEVAGQLSSAKITLRAISDISNQSSINVNLITHLEKARVEYLIAQGSAFADAKTQAQTEILSIFNISATGLGSSETFDISQGATGDAILLAISVILQGTHTPAQLTELLSAISTDLREDGIFNSTISQSELINEAALLDLVEVRTNIENRYNSLGVTATIGDFESYITNFINTTTYINTKIIEYPAMGLYGTNILNDTTSYFDGNGTSNSLTAVLPKGTALRILIEYTDSITYDSLGTPSMSGNWGYSSEYNWLVTWINPENQEFTVIDPDIVPEMDFSFGGTGSAKVHYFENGSLVATKVKQIYWAP